MKNKLIIITTILVLSLSMIGGYFTIKAELNQLKENAKEDKTLQEERDSVIINSLDTLNLKLNGLVSELKPINAFLEAMGFAESSNNYGAVNTYGFIGNYQFGNGALVEAKVCKNRKEAKKFSQRFIDTPDSLRTNVWSKLEQDKAMLNYMAYNQKKLKKHIKEYSNTFLITDTDTIYVTESGILASAHLAGFGNVKKFFDNKDHKFADAYGTTIQKYLNRFRGYRV